MSHNSEGPPPASRFVIKELGGFVHYSREMLAYLSRLPATEADRVTREIEYKHRPRRILVCPKCEKSSQVCVCV